MSILIAILFYSQLVDNASSVLCSRWDPQANGVSEICSCYISSTFKWPWDQILVVCLGCLLRLAIQYLTPMVIWSAQSSWKLSIYKHLFDDIYITGARGVWITDSCNQSHMTSRSAPTTHTSETSVETEAPTFTAQYSQPGHFGLLLVSHARVWRNSSHYMHVVHSNMSFCICTQDLTDGSVPPLPPVYGVVLQSFSYVGLVISLLCLTAFIITHLASRWSCLYFLSK